MILRPESVMCQSCQRITVSGVLLKCADSNFASPRPQVFGSRRVGSSRRFRARAHLNGTAPNHRRELAAIYLVRGRVGRPFRP